MFATTICYSHLHSTEVARSTVPPHQRLPASQWLPTAVVRSVICNCFQWRLSALSFAIASNDAVVRSILLHLAIFFFAVVQQRLSSCIILMFDRIRNAFKSVAESSTEASCPPRAAETPTEAAGCPPTEAAGCLPRAASIRPRAAEAATEARRRPKAAPPRVLGSVLGSLRAKMQDDIKAETNKESWYIPADLDNGEDRAYYYLAACPCAEECTKDSFKNSRCWSFIGPEKVYCYAKYHLKFSAHHRKSNEEADDALVKGDMKHSSQSFAEREEERAQKDERDQKKRAKQEEEDKDKGKDKGKGKGQDKGQDKGNDKGKDRGKGKGTVRGKDTDDDDGGEPKVRYGETQTSPGVWKEWTKEEWKKFNSGGDWALWQEECRLSGRGVWQQDDRRSRSPRSIAPSTPPQARCSSLPGYHISVMHDSTEAMYSGCPLSSMYSGCPLSSVYGGCDDMPSI
jgi:hypothetical protein